MSDWANLRVQVHCGRGKPKERILDQAQVRLGFKAKEAGSLHWDPHSQVWNRLNLGDYTRMLAARDKEITKALAIKHTLEGRLAEAQSQLELRQAAWAAREHELTVHINGFTADRAAQDKKWEDIQKLVTP